MKILTRSSLLSVTALLLFGSVCLANSKKVITLSSAFEGQYLRIDHDLSEERLIVTTEYSGYGYQHSYLDDVDLNSGKITSSRVDLYSVPYSLYTYYAVPDGVLIGGIGDRESVNFFV